jgi:hypothetical protein
MVVWQSGKRAVGVLMVDIAAGELPAPRSFKPWALYRSARAKPNKARVRRAVIALILIAATGVAASGVIAEDLFWADQAEQARGLMDGQ